MRNRTFLFRKTVRVGTTAILFLLLSISHMYGPRLPDTMYNKIFCGYQGWFGAPGDDPVNDISWVHWCRGGTEPMPDTVTFDIWPDYSEYAPSTLFYSTAYPWEYKDGREAGFYSSNLEEVILLHCRWMRDYGIDGVFVQRFTHTLQNPVHQAREDNVLRFMMKGAKLYGIKVAVMYDITGTGITQIAKILSNDWLHLVKDLKITEGPGYQRHPDKAGFTLPVVGVWGFGFLGEGVRGQARLVVDLFKNHKDAGLHATILGGVPAFWRTLDRDSKVEYKEIYKLFDIISPWMVGRVANREDVENWTDTMREDIKKTGSRGQEYMPVSFPGFSASNLAKNLPLTSPKADRMNKIYSGVLNQAANTTLNLIPRDGGDFMWSQFYHWRKADTDLLYIAMFDEVDEATAIFKLAETEELETSPDLFITLDSDGVKLRNDHYLWMAGVLNFMVNGGLAIPEEQPDRLHPSSLLLSRNLGIGGGPEELTVVLEITLRSTEGTRAEVYRKEHSTRQTALIHRFNLARDSLYSKEIIADNSIEQDDYYSYICIVYDESDSIIAVSDIKGTSKQ